MKKSTSPYHMKEFEKVSLSEEKVKLFPFLKNISSKKNLQLIAQLIEKISTAEYDPKIKYNVLWDIVQLGTLLESNLSESVTDKVTLTTLDAIDPTSKHCAELTDQQQWCLFKIARNIIADSFHIIYEDKTRSLIEQVIQLCQGSNVKDVLSEQSKEVTKLSRGRNVAKILSDDKMAQTKMFHQTGYFLERAKMFTVQGNPQAACMALIGAGCCCRFILIGKVSGGAKLPGVEELNILRSNIVHDEALDITGTSQSKTAQVWSGKIDGIMVKLINEAMSLGLELDVKGYIEKEKPTDLDESPRGYIK